MSPFQRTRTLGIVGLGLMGGSLARAVKEAGLPWRVRGLARDPETRRAALAAGAVDEACATAAEAARGADLVVIALPVRSIPDAARDLAPHLAPGTIVTDVGSTKAALTRRVEAVLPPGVPFVGGHPIAGTEESGFTASFAGLYRGARCLLTPGATATPAAVAAVREPLGVGRHAGGGAGCRHPRPHPRRHQPPAPRGGLRPRQRGRARRRRPPRAAFVHRRRLSRLHPDRSLAPGDVARHLPRQPRRGAQGARRVPRGGRAPALAHRRRRRSGSRERPLPPPGSCAARSLPRHRARRHVRELPARPRARRGGAAGFGRRPRRQVDLAPRPDPGLPGPRHHPDQRTFARRRREEHRPGAAPPRRRHRPRGAPSRSPSGARASAAGANPRACSTSATPAPGSA